MSELVRFGVSINKELLNKFDSLIKKKSYLTRSKAIIDLITEDITRDSYSEEKEVVGTINIVFDHLKKELSSKLTEIQHTFHEMIISSQHIHLNHKDCLEIIVVKGQPKEVQKLAFKIKSTKGVKFSTLNITSTNF